MRFPGWLAGSCEIGAECSRAVRVCARAAGFAPSHSVTAASTQKMNPVSAVWVGKKKNNSDTCAGVNSRSVHFSGRWSVAPWGGGPSRGGLVPGVFVPAPLPHWDSSGRAFC